MLRTKKIFLVNLFWIFHGHHKEQSQQNNWKCVGWTELYEQYHIITEPKLLQIIRCYYSVQSTGPIHVINIKNCFKNHFLDLSTSPVWVEESRHKWSHIKIIIFKINNICGLYAIVVLKRVILSVSRNQNFNV